MNHEGNYLKSELYNLISEDESIFDFIQESALDGLWYWDLEHPENEWMNPRFWTTLGYDPEEMPHKSAAWQGIINEEDLELAKEKIATHLSDPSVLYDQIIRYRHKNGNTVWIRCRGMAFTDETGKPVRMLGAHNDVSDLKRKEELLLKSNEELEHFAYAVSHDLKEPVRMIRSFMELLEKKYGSNLDDKGRKYIHYAVDGAKRMNILIEELLEYSRINKPQEEHEKVCIESVLEKVVKLNRSIIEKKCASIYWSDMPDIAGHNTSLQQVFNNLISNSLKYCSEERTPIIEINFTEKDDRWQFSVSDNGPGIDPQYHNVIFDIFRRVKNSPVSSGSGIGLAICKKIVGHYGGEIWLESEVGKGSTFHFTILKDLSTRDQLPENRSGKFSDNQILV